MYHFAIVALLALATYKTVEFLLGLAGIEVRAAVRTFLMLGVGVLFAEILDYSVFAAWGVTVREAWMGPVWTGLVIGAMTSVWHEVLGLVEGYGRKSRDQALEIEQRAPRAA